MDCKFYVYAHRRKSDGEIFYIGKGCGPRASILSGRSKWWGRIANKHRCDFEILYSGLSENLAFLLEKHLIKDIGRHRLCNATDGGEGLSGYVASEETRKLLSIAGKGRLLSGEAKKKISEKLSRRVFCSNGMVFESSPKAVEWLRENGSHGARCAGISRAALGERKLAFGYAWSYTGVPMFDQDAAKEETRRLQSEAKRGKPAKNVKAVRSSLGEEFSSAKLAAKWLRDNGYPKASNSAICAVINGRKKTAYGRTWHEQ